ncbi:hypothetical protein ACFX2C_044333 [Malus domestica]
MTVSISAIYTPLFSQNPLFVPTPISKLPKVISPSPQPPPRSSVLCLSSPPDMDATTGPSLYPLHRTKTLHLVRHAQGIHNVEGDKDHAAYMSYDLFDAHLTPLGWSQYLPAVLDILYCIVNISVSLMLY